VKHWSRVRELDADAASRLPSGPQAPARALVRTALISSVADRVMTETAEKPLTAAPDLVEAMVQRAAQDGFPDPSSALPDRQPHPTDTHPPTIARIEALGLAADEALLARAGRPVQPAELERVRGLFADWTALCRALSADAVDFAAARYKKNTSELRRVAAQRVESSTEVFQDVRGPVVRLAITTIIFGGIGVVAGYATMSAPWADPTLPPIMLMVAGAGVVVGLLALWAAVATFRSRTTPYLTLTPDGFVGRGLDRMVPWIGVDRVNMVTGRAIHLQFFLGEMTKLPRRVSGRTIVVNAKRRMVVVIGKRPRGMKPDALLQLIGRYLKSAHAQAALDGLDPNQTCSAVLTAEELGLEKANGESSALSVPAAGQPA
jgi:hypothetical protein